MPLFLWTIHFQFASYFVQAIMSDVFFSFAAYASGIGKAKSEPDATYSGASGGLSAFDK